MQSFGNFNESIKADWVAEIIPCPYDKTTSYGHGTNLGPEAIVEASQELEFFDDECGYDCSTLGIKTLEPVELELQDASTKEPFKALQDKCADAYSRSKFPVVLGGEHSLSLGPIKAAYEHSKAQGEELLLLHFDAHADLRQEYLGNPYSHAAAIYQVYKHCPGIKIVSVGIRNISQGEVEWIANGGDADRDINDIKIFYAAQERKNSLSQEGSWLAKDVIEHVKRQNANNLYITFDVDGYDSALMPSTGTPEPGGLDWYTPINIIRESVKAKNLIGADVVELAPIPALVAPDFLTAKLIYKILSYKFAA